jgi:hypothetical protein
MSRSSTGWMRLPAPPVIGVQMDTIDAILNPGV